MRNVAVLPHHSGDSNSPLQAHPIVTQVQVGYTGVVLDTEVITNNTISNNLNTLFTLQLAKPYTRPSKTPIACSPDYITVMVHNT